MKRRRMGKIKSRMRKIIGLLATPGQKGKRGLVDGGGTGGKENYYLSVVDREKSRKRRSAKRGRAKTGGRLNFTSSQKFNRPRAGKGDIALLGEGR